MLNGLEVRPVFLDDRILNYSLSQNQKKNVGYLKSKKELRKNSSGFHKKLIIKKSRDLHMIFLPGFLLRAKLFK